MTDQTDQTDEPIHVNVVAFDYTQYFNLDAFDHAEYIQRIYSVYMYPRNVVYHCASATRSYAIFPLRHTAEFSDIIEDVPAEQKDKILDETNMELMECVERDPHHQRVSDLDKYVEEHPDLVFVDDYDYDTIDEAIDWHHENHFVK